MAFFTKTLKSQKIFNPQSPGIGHRRSKWNKPILSSFLFFIAFCANANTQTIPATPGAISGLTNVCAFVGTGETVTYSIAPVAGAELYLWTLPPTMTLVSGQGTTAITVQFSSGFTSAANKQIRVRAISDEGNSADRIMYLAAQHPSTPNAIYGPSNACVYIGTPNRATYTTPKDRNATGYIWSAPSGASIMHPNGAGPNDTIVMVSFKPGYKTGGISVQSFNTCGISASRTITVSGSAPTMPGMISGPTNVCAYMLPNGVAATYSIAPVAGASSYSWSLPDDCIIDHPNGGGVGDVSINVQFPANFTGGTISVTANSGCDESAARTLTLTKLNPSTPGIISPALEEICPTREYSYTLPSMPANTNSINWTVPADAIGFSGQGTTKITVLYPESRISGSVSATGVNNCATSASRVIAINLGRCQLERGTNSAGRASAGLEEIGLVSLADTEAPIPGFKVSPNPSKSGFKLQWGSAEKAKANIRVLDLQGREVKKMIMSPGQSIVFGNELRPGTYIVEVAQGKQIRTQKLMKL